jgi:hypothetical protein
MTKLLYLGVMWPQLTWAQILGLFEEAVLFASTLMVGVPFVALAWIRHLRSERNEMEEYPKVEVSEPALYLLTAAVIVPFFVFGAPLPYPVFTRKLDFVLPLLASYGFVIVSLILSRKRPGSVRTGSLVLSIINLPCTVLLLLKCLQK